MGQIRGGHEAAAVVGVARDPQIVVDDLNQTVLSVVVVLHPMPGRVGMHPRGAADEDAMAIARIVDAGAVGMDDRLRTPQVVELIGGQAAAIGHGHGVGRGRVGQLEDLAVGGGHAGDAIAGVPHERDTLAAGLGGGGHVPERVVEMLGAAAQGRHEPDRPAGVIELDGGLVAATVGGREQLAGGVVAVARLNETPLIDRAHPSGGVVLYAGGSILLIELRDGATHGVILQPPLRAGRILGCGQSTQGIVDRAMGLPGRVGDAADRSGSVPLDGDPSTGAVDDSGNSTLSVPLYAALVTIGVDIGGELTGGIVGHVLGATLGALDADEAAGVVEMVADRAAQGIDLSHRQAPGVILDRRLAAIGIRTRDGSVLGVVLELAAMAQTVHGSDQTTLGVILHGHRALCGIGQPHESALCVVVVAR